LLISIESLAKLLLHFPLVAKRCVFVGVCSQRESMETRGANPGDCATFEMPALVPNRSNVRIVTSDHYMTPYGDFCDVDITGASQHPTGRFDLVLSICGVSFAATRYYTCANLRIFAGVKVWEARASNFSSSNDWLIYEATFRCKNGALLLTSER